MPTGERGFTYLGLLMALALGGAGLAALGTQWSVGAEREREAELLFRGAEVQRAVGRYWGARTPHELPPSMDALLVDRRSQPARHHLRRAYADPFGGQAGWRLVTDPASGRLLGVASRRERLHHRRDAPTRFVFEPPAVPVAEHTP
jgi:type II secretory pathway pseudopilin PulG